MKLVTLKSLYIEELDDLHSAETQLIVALPRLVKSANHPELKQAFRSHLEETRNQLRRLDLIFEDLEITPGGEVCEATEGLVAEAEEMIHAYGDPDVRDVALIACAQRVEHYEMAAYGSARSFARHLGFDKHVQLLQQTLDEEGGADKKLTELAEGGWFTSGLNWEAAQKR